MTEVYANGREIACKASSGKTIAAFPDTCLSPPSPPAGPVPIPYPNTAYAKDTTGGSTTVMICGQEVMLKDTSSFKTSTGDEAATKSLGMNVITHTIQGEASFVCWSMDVMIEGANVDRHLDLTIDNEQSSPGGTGPAPHNSSQAMQGVVVLECRDEWDDCQKAQMKGKVRALNGLAKENGGLIGLASADIPRSEARIYQARYRSQWNAPDLGDWPAGSNPCNQEKQFYAKCAETQAANNPDFPDDSDMQADHVLELQIGGAPDGPFRWLDSAVNQSSGSQIRGWRQNNAGQAVTGFKSSNC